MWMRKMRKWIASDRGEVRRPQSGEGGEFRG